LTKATRSLSKSKHKGNGAHRPTTKKKTTTRKLSKSSPKSKPNSAHRPKCTMHLESRSGVKGRDGG
jgi:hypothetical protein